MKLGIIRPNEAQYFDYAKEKGLEFLELCTNFDNESEDFIAAVDATKANIERTGIPVLSVGRWNAEPLSKGKVDENVFELMKKQIDATAAIGCGVFNLGVNYENDQSLYRNYCGAVEYLGRLGEYAKTKGVTLALYNCGWNNFLCKDAGWEIVLGELPELMLKYDCSHTMYRGDDYLWELDKWCHRVAHMHVKGTCIINGKHVDDPPAGMDSLKWREIFALLYAHGYDKTLSIEPHSATWSGELGDRGVDFTIDFIRPFILR